MCTSPQIPLREKLFFMMICETTTRRREVLEARIELWNRNTGEITFPIPNSIFTEGETTNEIKKNIMDALSCHFDNIQDILSVIRLPFVREEILTYVQNA